MSLLGCVQSLVEVVFTSFAVALLRILLYIEQQVHLAEEELTPLAASRSETLAEFRGLGLVFLFDQHGRKT